MKNINLFKTEMEGHEPALCCHTHIYLSNRILQIQFNSLEHSRTSELYLLGDNTRITKQEVPVVLCATANFIGQLSSILINNLNMKAPV